MQEPLRSVDIFSQITPHRSTSSINIRRLRRATITRRRQHSIFVFLISLVTALGFIGCKSEQASKPNQPATAAEGKKLAAVTDAELTEQIESFSTYVGGMGATAWSQLQSYPRDELINRLTQ